MKILDILKTDLPERKTKSNQSVKLVLTLNTNTLILQLGDLIDLLVNYVMMLTACSYLGNKKKHNLLIAFIIFSSGFLIISSTKSVILFLVHQGG